jgi:predicted methyltransferase
MTTWVPSLRALVVAASIASGCARGTTPPAGKPGGVTHVAHPGVTPFVRNIVLDPDRLEADRALDAGRHPEELLAFLEVAPGLRLGEIGAGGGYTTELVARAVGERGRVFAENNRFVLERFAAKPWADRLQRVAMRNVVRVDREFDDPLPPEARDLDAVYIVLFYHDTVWMGADRDRMNRAVFSALRPGGFYFVVDHAARAGRGTADVQTLHRIDEAFVIAEVERAGFKLNAVGDFLRNPADKHDWNASPRTAGERRGTSDRFALQFVKPARNVSPAPGG